MVERDLHDEDLLPSLGEFVELISEPAFEAVEQLIVEQMTIETPFELQILRQSDDVVVRASPPTQRTETTVLPIWHHLRLTLETDDG